MDALNHADQMRLANLINDNSDDVEMQKKIDQVVELTNSSRDHAAVALHDSNYDVEKAVDMILEGDHNIENQWKSAGKRKNKQQSQAAKAAAAAAAAAAASTAAATSANLASSSNAATHATTSSSSTSAPNHNVHHNQHHHQHHHNAPGNAEHNVALAGGDSFHKSSTANSKHNQTSSSSNAQAVTTATQLSANHHEVSRSSHISTNTNNSNLVVGNNTHHTGDRHGQGQQHSNRHKNNKQMMNENASESLKNLIGISSENLVPKNDSLNSNQGSNAAPVSQSSTTTTTAAGGITNQPSMHQYNKAASDSLKNLIGISTSSDTTVASINLQRNQGIKTRVNTRIPESAVEMPNSKQQLLSLNLQFGELDLGETGGDSKGFFSEIKGQRGRNNNRNPVNIHSNPQQQHDIKNRPSQQNKSLGNRRPYNNDDRRGRPMSGTHRSFNQGPSNPQMGNTNRGNPRTVINRTLPPNSLSTTSANQTSGVFSNSIDVWTNSTAENATKVSEPSVMPSIKSKVGQWSDVAGAEDWNEEDWEAKVMESKVFPQSSSVVDGPSVQKVKLSSDPKRDDINQQSSVVTNVISEQNIDLQQAAQKQIPPMNGIFDDPVARAVLAQQLQLGRATLPSTYSAAPTTNASSINQVQKANVGLKDLDTQSKGIPSVPPGALPVMSQPPYILGNAFQPAIFPYAAYQAADVHYQVAAHTAGREQNFQSVYSPNDANKFNRGAEGDASSINTTQSHPFVTNPLHGYQLTYAMPGAYNMMPQNMYGFSHNAQQQSSINPYPLLHGHNQENSNPSGQPLQQSNVNPYPLLHGQNTNMNSQGNQSKSGAGKYYPSWN